MSLSSSQIAHALSRKLLRNRHTRIMMEYYGEKLPRLKTPGSPAEWEERTAGIRRDLLKKVYLKGLEPDVNDRPPDVRWKGVLKGNGYRIRKCHYEGYPGMRIPALLYEPEDLRGKVPAVLNPNGHHRGGKAMDYKQARCINLAKRGMLALNFEFIGMGELQGSLNHMQQAHIDLCGVAGVSAMYLAMKRGLDVLLAHEHADPDRVAMTGLSGGGWQTAVLTAIDERIGVSVPVSGHSPIWHRATRRWQDHGDLEQTPVDLCTVADYDTLTAMFAPRPALLVHSVNDGIFRPEFMRPALYSPARRVYEKLGVPERIGFYANKDPGTHNYEKDNREQLYEFLKKSWTLDISTEDIPCEDEIRTEWELNVGLPPDNPTFLSIAADLAGRLPVKRSIADSRKHDRKRLARVLRLPSAYTVESRAALKSRTLARVSISHHLLKMGRWNVPVTEFDPQDSNDVLLILPENGRAGAARAVQHALEAGKRVFAADLLAFGEQVIANGEYHYLFMECIAAAGDRPLGICTAQLLALRRWIGSTTGGDSLSINTQGLSTGLIALCAAALRPRGVDALSANLPDTLRRLIDWSVDYTKEPVSFCFGLLEQFDIEDLVLLSHPVDILIDGRGPMR
ncbi:MAG: acetylxylan esterase [Gemmatimonadota bacterium]|nr:acetylxylan esterase [Gemmatimonadota bacterium]